MNPDFAAYPLIDALKERRSRRFCRGMTLEGGPLSFASRHGPVPLSPLEEASMVFAACGITGCALGDLAYGNDSGGNIMAGLIGRTVASGDGIQTVSLITINDSGAFLYRRPQDLPPAVVREVAQRTKRSEFVQAAELMRVRICEQRVRISAKPILNINANRWSAHAAGTTCFLPVNEMTFMYINGLLEILNEHTGVFIVDERASFRPAGLAKFAKSKGGHLDDNPVEGKVVTTAQVERLVTEFVTTEQGMMLQNLGLMAQALGLAGYPNFANHDFAWFEALNFRMASLPASAYLNVRGLPALALRLLKRNVEVPFPLGLERNGEVMLKSYAPPYFPSMRDAVEAVVAQKSGERGVFRGSPYPTPWKDESVKTKVDGISDKAIAAATAYCEYMWRRYGRFPAHTPAFRTVLGFQAGHIDPEFYEKYYAPEALGETQRVADRIIQEQEKKDRQTN